MATTRREPTSLESLDLGTTGRVLIQSPTLLIIDQPATFAWMETRRSPWRSSCCSTWLPPPPPPPPRGEEEKKKEGVKQGKVAGRRSGRIGRTTRQRGLRGPGLPLRCAAAMLAERRAWGAQPSSTGVDCREAPSGIDAPPTGCRRSSGGSDISSSSSDTPLRPRPGLPSTTGHIGGTSSRGGNTGGAGARVQSKPASSFFAEHQVAIRKRLKVEQQQQQQQQQQQTR